MYSYEERMRAIELYIHYDRTSAPTIREPGYPSRKALYRWYREYEQSGDLHEEYRRDPKYSDEQKQAAVEYDFERGHNTAATVRALGYPSRALLRLWIDELRPGSRKAPVKRGSAVPVTDEQRRRAVIALCSRDSSAESVAASVGVSRQALFGGTVRDTLRLYANVNRHVVDRSPGDSPVPRGRPWMKASRPSMSHPSMSCGSVTMSAPGRRLRGVLA